MNWSNRVLAVWTLSLLPLASNGLLAQSNTPNLVEQAQAAKESFHPVAHDQIVHSKQQLQQAMAQLDQLLARSQPAYRQGWKTYLHWDEINQALANDES